MKVSEPATTTSSSPNFTQRHFQPNAKRNTSCLLVRSKDSEQYSLITSLATRWDTQLIKIDPKGGRLQFDNRKGVDVFATEGEALDRLALSEQHEIVERGCALLGYAPVGNVGMVLLATRVRPVATLPGGHVVKLVAESKWLQVPLQEFGDHGKRLSPEEMDNLQQLPNYTLNNAHYYCETIDITRPFPSSQPVASPSWEFVWNRWLSAALRATSLPGHCPHLLQGVVESRTLDDVDGDKYTIALFSRRSRLHPGTRYIARGLNGLASCGNEIECEQVVWTCSSKDDDTLKWSSYVWRRGTVPIWWGVELKSGGVGEATIVVSSEHPYKGTKRYFRRLQRRYVPNPDVQASIRSVEGRRSSSGGASSSGGESDGEAAADVDRSLRVPVTCINLLRCNMQRKDELLLSEHFSEGVRTVRRAFPNIPIRVLNFDWHGMIKELKEKGTVEGLWELLQTVMSQANVSQGTLEPVTSPSSARVPGTTTWDNLWAMRWSGQQQGLLRYNCADSLDRTNAASYFGAVQVLVEQCRRLGINIEPTASAPSSAAARSAASKAKKNDVASLEISSIHRRVKDLMRERMQAPKQAEAPLPAGWEQSTDPTTGKTFYIDHNTKATTWVRPGAVSAAAAAEQAAAETKASEPAHGPDSGANSESEGGESDSATGTSRGQRPGWGLFGCSVDDMRTRLLPDLVACHAEIFLINGDMNSNLYTSSRAMHSAILGLLQGESGAVSKAGIGKLQNISVSVQRRWNNVLSDATRQSVVEMFLGLRLDHHFPSVKFLYNDSLPMNDDSDEEVSEDEGEAHLPPIKPQDAAVVNEHALLEAAAEHHAPPEPVQSAGPAVGAVTADLLDMGSPLPGSASDFKLPLIGMGPEGQPAQAAKAVTSTTWL
ncbi:hypothetical protein WJX72_010447 [[Myrmecia] bisecta]|uniref:Phosphoinositide phosphatase SAC9 n=1 Tax=[Myrmecia] bisecta TaxID=41462 RepID=A0AAW1QB36_9CHLO